MQLFRSRRGSPRENGWPRAFAARAIEEYRKFCFLAVHAGHPVTPSDEVDQVWHLHLTYSRHYWDALCRDALERPLHHGPTEGGAAEDRKFHDWYETTLASYRRFFGEPPKDLWPASNERFDERHDFVRIDRRDVVTVDRALLKHGAMASLGAGALFAVAHALAQADGADASRAGLGPWVVLIAIVLVVFFVAAAASRRRKAPNGRPRKRRSADGALAAGGVAGCGSSSKHIDGGSNGDGADGAAGGCGSSGGGGGGGGGCGGGGGG